MREIFTYVTVGRAPGNRCLYPEADRLTAAAFWDDGMFFDAGGYCSTLPLPAVSLVSRSL
jgi:hypothetical protein